MAVPSQARQEGRAGRVVVRQNAKIVFDGKPPFANSAWGALRTPIPGKLLRAEPPGNVLTIETRQEGQPDDQARLVIQYAVLRGPKWLEAP